jgi:hypothetical protein
MVKYSRYAVGFAVVLFGSALSAVAQASADLESQPEPVPVDTQQCYASCFECYSRCGSKSGDARDDCRNVCYGINEACCQGNGKRGKTWDCGCL